MSLADVAGGVNEAIQQQMMRRYAQMIQERQWQQSQRAYADSQKQQQFENTRQTSADERAGKQLDATVEGNRIARDNSTANINSEIQRRQDESTAKDQELTMSALEQQTPGAQMASDNPLYQKANTYGYLRTKSVVQPGGMGTDFQGPMPTGEAPESVANNSPRIITTSPTSKQQDKITGEADKAAALGRETARDAEIVRHNKGMEAAAANKPPAVQLISTVGDDGKPTQMFVPKTPGQSYSKPAPSIVENRVASAQTVQQTGNDIIAKLADPKYAAVVGPALGRASSLQDFIGNPPPEFSDLAGQIESYALANMGVHGMRSAEGAKAIAGLLNQRHTPESLSATIRGLNSFSQHFLENEGRAPAPAASHSQTAPAKLSVADMLKKYGGGQ